jgi:hypothetical protein
MGKVRHFVILAGDDAHLAFDHVGKKHGPVVQHENGCHSAVLFDSPCGKLVYGAVEFTPHPPEDE